MQCAILQKTYTQILCTIKEVPKNLIPNALTAFYCIKTSILVANIENTSDNVRALHSIKKKIHFGNSLVFFFINLINIQCKINQ